MQIQSLSIRNFKSIRELEILDVESSLILVGKNNTGKTAVLDAIRAVTGNYTVGAHDFNEKRQNIEIEYYYDTKNQEILMIFDGMINGEYNPELMEEIREGLLVFLIVPYIMSRMFDKEVDIDNKKWTLVNEIYAI